MESEFVQMIDRYAGKHAKTLFWLFVVAVFFSIAVLPLLVNLPTVWFNLEWVFSRVGIVSLVGKAAMSAAIALLALLFLRALTIIAALAIRLAYATPTHWRIETTLDKVSTLLQHAYGVIDDATVRVETAELQAELKGISDEWNSSRVTRLVRYVVRVGEMHRRSR